MEIVENLNQVRTIERTSDRGSSESTKLPDPPRAVSSPIFGRAKSLKSEISPFADRRAVSNSSSRPNHRTSQPSKGILRSNSGKTTVENPEAIIRNAETFDRQHYGPSRDFPSSRQTRVPHYATDRWHSEPDFLAYSAPIALADLTNPSPRRSSSSSRADKDKTTTNPKRQSHRKSHSLDCPDVDEERPEDENTPPPLPPKKKRPQTLTHRRSRIPLERGAALQGHYTEPVAEADSTPVHGPFELGDAERRIKELARRELQTLPQVGKPTASYEAEVVGRESKRVKLNKAPTYSKPKSNPPSSEQHPKKLDEKKEEVTLPPVRYRLSLRGRSRSDGYLSELYWVRKEWTNWLRDREARRRRSTGRWRTRGL